MKLGVSFLLLFVFMIFGSVGMSGQGSESIYLKDGSIIKGEIIENSDYRVRIKIASGDTLSIGYKHISSVGQDSNAGLFSHKANKKKKTHLNSGAFIGLSTGVTFAGDTEAGYQLGLNFGKRLSSKLYLGGSVDYKTFVTTFPFIYVEHDFVSLSAYGRYYFIDSGAKYYTAAKVGYSTSFNDQFSREFNESYFDEHSGGLSTELAIGIHFPSKQRFRILTEFSLSHQQTEGIYGAIDWFTNLPVRSSYQIDYIRPGIRIGIEF